MKLVEFEASFGVIDTAVSASLEATPGGKMSGHQILESWHVAFACVN